MTASGIRGYIQRLLVNVPPQHEPEFTLENVTINIQRGKKAVAVVLVFVVVQACLFYAGPGTLGERYFALPNHLYAGLYLLTAALLLTALVLFHRLDRPQINPKVVQGLENVFTPLLLLGFMVMSLETDQIAYYLIAILAIAVIPYLEPRRLLAIYVPLTVVYLAALALVQQPPAAELLSKVGGIGVFTGVAWFTSRMLYIHRRDDFLNRKTIAEQNEKLLRANERLRSLSDTDELTGIPNRRSFNRSLAQEWRNALRERHPLSILIIDVDFFKDYNDHYGHQAGDVCLRQIASALVGAAHRVNDVVARYGGDEFVALLPNTDEAGAAGVAERMRLGVQAKTLIHPAPQTSGRVSVSLGRITVTPEKHMTPDEFMYRADQALYRAKRNRRNCVVAVDGRSLA